MAVLTVITLLGLLASGCGSGDADTSGAAAPAKAGPAGTAPASPSASPTPTPSASADYSGNGAERVVAAYFQEINDASQEGRVADVSATAMPGCQPCALDIGMTRLFDQRGVRTEAAPYDVSGLTGDEPVGTAATVRFTAAVRAVRLLDPIGREAGTSPAGPVRAGAAQLMLTGEGWRIRTIHYLTGNPTGTT